MGTVSIAGKTFDIFGELSSDAGATISANTYFAASLNVTAWTAATSTTKSQSLVESTRILDKQLWAGTPTDVVTPQPLAWPRTGASDKDGTAIGVNATPDEVIFASYELASAILTDATIQTSGTGGSNLKRNLSTEKVGDLEVTTELEYFIPTIIGAADAGRFPPAVDEYLKGLLASGQTPATVTNSTASKFLCDDFGKSTPGL